MIKNDLNILAINILYIQFFSEIFRLHQYKISNFILVITNKEGTYNNIINIGFENNIMFSDAG